MNILIVGLLAMQASVGPWPHFAPGERFFPTLPFFMALGGDPLGNDSVKADFEDPWEVAPYLRDSANRGTHQQVILGFALHPLLASGYRPAYHR